MWYTREEQALVIGAFYSMNGFQQCVGGLIGYGIAHIQHAKLKNWQVLFLVSVARRTLPDLFSYMSLPATRIDYVSLGSFCRLVSSRQPNASKMLLSGGSDSARRTSQKK